jgi:hypothetical protein
MGPGLCPTQFLIAGYAAGLSGYSSDWATNSSISGDNSATLFNQFSSSIRYVSSMKKVSHDSGYAMALRVELVDASQSSGYFRGPFGDLGEGGPGSYLVSDGRNGVLNLKREGIVEPMRGDDALHDLDILDWRLPARGLGDLCTRIQHTAAGVENVAGHWAHVLHCDGLGQSFRIWVDVEAGLILRLRNDVLPAGVEPVLGDFEFTLLEYNPLIQADSFLTGLLTDFFPLVLDDPDWGDAQITADYERYLSQSASDLFNNSSALTRGEEVPPLAGQFLDGDGPTCAIGGHIWIVSLSPLVCLRLLGDDGAVDCNRGRREST